MHDTDNFMKTIVPDNIVNHPRINHFSIALDAIAEANYSTEAFHLYEIQDICKKVWCSIINSFDDYQDYLDEQYLNEKLKKL